MLPKLHFISQGATPDEHFQSIESAIEAGCSWVQLRMKDFTHETILKTAQKLKELCGKKGVLLTINDSIDIAKQVNADGVHLGLTDDSIQKARTILGSKCIIGGTANTLEDVITRSKEGCNYVGLGPLRSTLTKKKLSPTLGFEGYEILLNDLKSREITLPIFAIGGIQLEDTQPLIQIGAYGIAVSSAISNALNKQTITNEFNAILYA